MEKKRNLGIDFTKFVCAIMVVGIHIAPFGIQETNSVLYYANFYLQNCVFRIAVPFFFVCNGYFLCMRMDYDGDTGNIIKNTFFKILKLYLIWSAIYFPLNLISIYKNGKGLVHGLLSYAKNFLLTGSYTQLWYLNALCVALLIIYICYKLKIRLKHMMVIAAILYVIGLMGNSYFNVANKVHIFSLFFKTYNSIFITTRNGVFEALFFVTIGMALFKNKDKILQKKVWGCLLCSCVLWFVEVSLLKHFNLAKNYDCTFFVVPVVILLFITVLNINISNEVLCKKLGILSRLIFYTHLLVAFIIDIMIKHIPSHLLSTPLRFGTVVVITILISIFVFRLSEKKKLEWIKKLY